MSIGRGCFPMFGTVVDKLTPTDIIGISMPDPRIESDGIHPSNQFDLVRAVEMS
jgi:hypothetical protein